MALTVFKFIFLGVFFIGALIMLVTPLFFPKGARDNPQVNRKVTKIRLIGLIIGCVGLLIVLILAGIKQ